MSDERTLARRWANRRATGHPRNAPASALPPTALDPAAQLLSDYEDALAASNWHNLVPEGQSAADESAHVIEARRLHADVRRLRVELLALLDIALADRDPAD